MGTVPDVYTLGKWDLSDLMPDATPETLEARLRALEEAVTAFEAHRSHLRPDMDPEEFLQILKEYEAIVETIHTLSGFAQLWFSENTQSPEALDYRNRVQQVLADVENRLLFFSIWWKSLSDEEAERLLPSAPEHADYRHFLLSLRRFKPFTLDERSEQIINLKDANGVEALLTLYAMLTNRLEFELEVDGEIRRLTRDELMAYAYSPRAELREAAYKALYKVYGEESPILAQVYINRVRDWHNENIRLRGFSSPIAVRNLLNDIPDRAVDVLLTVARENAPLFQKYFRLKAEWLGVKKLRRYDIYAPLSASDRRISYDEAVRLVLDTLEQFDPDVAAKARRVFEEGHIDSEPRKGKRGGAFCMTVSPRYTPWVLVNFTGRLRDVATLAHELGHAIHSMLAEHHSILTQHPPLPLAETASVFSEMLLTDRLLREEQDPLARRELIASALDDMYATVMRQAYFVLFEKEAHTLINQGTSVQELYRVYMDLLEEQFGDSVDVSEEFRYEWVSIPHIYYTPFYCYAYSFGQLLVLALYRQYQEEGAPFIPKYLKLLAYGGSARPAEILQEMGIDIESPEFWQKGFDVIADMMERL
ncbi:MAG: M3 family oligoendopeptidase [Chloroflexi bacterium]|nr:M3 family oligoendopeptidase [Chloroflexota bacterium]